MATRIRWGLLVGRLPAGGPNHGPQIIRRTTGDDATIYTTKFARFWAFSRVMPSNKHLGSIDRAEYSYDLPPAEKPQMRGANIFSFAACTGTGLRPNSLVKLAKSLGNGRLTQLQLVMGKDSPVRKMREGGAFQ